MECSAYTMPWLQSASLAKPRRHRYLFCEICLKNDADEDDNNHD